MLHNWTTIAWGTPINMVYIHNIQSVPGKVTTIDISETTREKKSWIGTLPIFCVLNHNFLTATISLFDQQLYVYNGNTCTYFLWFFFGSIHVFMTHFIATFFSKPLRFRRYTASKFEKNAVFPPPLFLKFWFLRVKKYCFLSIYYLQFTPVVRVKILLSAVLASGNVTTATNCYHSNSLLP